MATVITTREWTSAGTNLQYYRTVCYCVVLRCCNQVVITVNGRDAAQVVSRRPVTAETRVRARVNPYGICGGQSGIGIGFSPSPLVFPCQYHSTVALQTHIIWECVIC
jgi:hypothetical protein